MTGLRPPRQLMPPRPALEGLRAELATQGLATVGMTVTRLQGMLKVAEVLAWGTAVAGCSGPQDGSA
jgi:hypothetical protein